MRAISDSSPLIVFARSGLLALLRDLFTEVLVPPAVYHEVTRAQPRLSDAVQLSEAAWIRIQHPSVSAHLDELTTVLGRGESEAIALASETTGPLTIILDDARARRIALSRGLQVIGSAGVLILAKRRALISEVNPLLLGLMASGLYLSDRHAREVLAAVGEHDGDESG